MKTKQKGFTLIELLVVIAIIGILASVVLTSLNSARKKGQDGKVKSQVTQVAAAAAIYYDNNNGSYGPVAANCTSGMWIDSASSMSTYAAASAAASWPGPVTCNSGLQTYAFMAQLVTDPAKGFCIDSTGITKTTTWAATLAGPVCP
jgi:prepilin-type N-terminal cleavage/methylation domain-containing protein